MDRRRGRPAPGAALLGQAQAVGQQRMVRRVLPDDLYGKCACPSLAQNSPQESAGPLDSHPAGPERLAAWQQTTNEVRASSDLVPRQRGF